MFNFFRKNRTIKEIYCDMRQRYILTVKSSYPDNLDFRVLTQADFDQLFEMIDNLEDRIDRMKAPVKVTTAGTESFYPGKIITVGSGTIKPVMKTLKVITKKAKEPTVKKKTKSDTKNTQTNPQ